MIAVKTLLPLFAAVTLTPAAVVDAHPCESQARMQAQRLLKFHLGIDERDAADEQITIDKRVHTLVPARNPADHRQRLDVLELFGYMGRGGFRIRLLYVKGDTSECLPVGQEIINWASY